MSRADTPIITPWQSQSGLTPIQTPASDACTSTGETGQMRRCSLTRDRLDGNWTADEDCIRHRALNT